MLRYCPWAWNIPVFALPTSFVDLCSHDHNNGWFLWPHCLTYQLSRVYPLRKKRVESKSPNLGSFWSSIPSALFWKSHNIDSERLYKQSPFVNCLNRPVSEMISEKLLERNGKLYLFFMNKIHPRKLCGALCGPITEIYMVFWRDHCGAANALEYECSRLTFTFTFGATFNFKNFFLQPCLR